jgi:hypothetical protein
MIVFDKYYGIHTRSVNASKSNFNEMTFYLNKMNIK